MVTMLYSMSYYKFPECTYYLSNFYLWKYYQEIVIVALNKRAGFVIFEVRLKTKSNSQFLIVEIGIVRFKVIGMVRFKVNVIEYFITAVKITFSDNVIIIQLHNVKLVSFFILKLCG